MGVRAAAGTLGGVVGLYRDESNELTEHPLTPHGLKQETVAGCLALLREHFPKPVEDILNKLEHGENLNREHPLLWLRNWLMNFATRWGLKVELADMTDADAIRRPVRPGQSNTARTDNPATPSGAATDSAAAAAIAPPAGPRSQSGEGPRAEQG